MLAIVLSRHDFREHDQLVSLYTLEQGKVEVLARGVKKITAKNAAALEPFAIIELETAPGKEITHLTTAQIVQLFPFIRSSLTNLSLGRLILQMVDDATDVGQTDSGIFLILRECLEYLNTEESPVEAVIAGFILRLWGALGFRPHLNNCVVCGNQLSGGPFAFAFENGGLAHPSCLKNQPAELLASEDAQVLQKLLDGSAVQPLSASQNAKMHTIVYQFVLYQASKPVPDWQPIFKHAN